MLNIYLLRCYSFVQGVGKPKLLDVNQYTPFSPGHTDDGDAFVLVGDASKVGQPEVFDVNPSYPLLQQHNDDDAELVNTEHVSSDTSALVNNILICGDVEIEDASNDDVSYLPSNHFSDIESNGSWQRDCVPDRALWSDDVEVFEVRKQNAMRKHVIKDKEKGI
ncbi:hypothetical protein Ancab_035916 [Ancistrocladus abbreviatus]